MPNHEKTNPQKPNGPEAQPNPDSAIEKQPVGYFEALAVDRLGNYLSNLEARPFFSPDERDILVRNQDVYFASIRADVKPDPNQKESLSLRQNRAEFKARKGRTKAYAQRLVASVTSVDNCRSWRWYLTKGEFEPPQAGDSLESVHSQVAAELGDLLTEARSRGFLAGGRSGPVVKKLKNRFGDIVGGLSDEERLSESAILASQLTVLAGKNSVLKTNEWLGQIPIISKGGRIFDPDLPNLLKDYNQGRSEKHRQAFDPLPNLIARLNLD